MKRMPLALASVLAIGLALAPVLSAAAAPKPSPISWSVEASGSTGNDGRLSFAYAVDPGTQINDYVSVTNSGTEAQTFKIYGADGITQLDTGAFSLKPAAAKSDDIGLWLTTKTNQITIPAGESAIIPFTILVPSDATPGDHTGGVIASVTSAAPGKKSGIGIDQRVGARVYLRVSGQPFAKVAATGLVAGFSPSWNPFGGGDATVDYDVTNSGNVREDVAQSVVLSGPFGIALGKAKPAPVLNILPGEKAHVHEKVSGIAALLLLFADVKLTPSKPTDLIGQSLLRDQNGKLVPPLAEPKFHQASSQALTGAISWTLLLIVLILIALIFFVVRYVRTTRERLYDAIEAANEQAKRDAAKQTAPREKASAGASERKS